MVPRCIALPTAVTHGHWDSVCERGLVTRVRGVPDTCVRQRKGSLPCQVPGGLRVHAVPEMPARAQNIELIKYLLALMLFNDANSTLHAVYMVGGREGVWEGQKEGRGGL